MGENKKKNQPENKNNKEEKWECVIDDTLFKGNVPLISEKELKKCSSFEKLSNSFEKTSPQNRKISANGEISQVKTLMIKVNIPEYILKDAIALYTQLKSWNKVKDEINKKYSQSYSIDIIVNRVKELIGKEEYNRLVSLSKKTIISLDTIQKIIVRYKQIGDLNQIADEFNYSYWILTENLKDYLGDLEYKKLIDEGQIISHSKRKIIIPEDIIKEMILKYKNYGDFKLVAKDYSEYKRDTIKDRINEYLGDNEYEVLIKKFSKKANIAFPRKINIPNNIIFQFIVNYKEYGSWNKVSNIFSDYKIALIIDKVKKYLGNAEYKSLVQNYAKKIPETIAISQNVLEEAIEHFKFLRSWEAVAEIYEFSSKTLIRRIIESIGQYNYNLLLENYPFRTEIPEPLLRLIINKYIETPSWAKVAADYEEYSVDIIIDRVKEFLGLENYLRLKELTKKSLYIEEYDTIFYEESFRTFIAWKQIINKIDIEAVELVSEDIVPNNWNEFDLFLFENKKWKFRDILDGEIIDKVSISELHHIDRDKKNNNVLNLVYLYKKNHGIITSAQKYWPDLSLFFENLLKNNVQLLSNGIIPESWKIGWKNLAIKQGFKFPAGKYN